MSARELGFEVKWLSARNVDPLLQAHVEVVPTFRASMYAPYMQGPSHRWVPNLRQFHGAMQKFIRRSRVTDPAEDGEPARQFSKLLRADLDRAIRRQKIGPSDRLLFHTADGATYAAVADLASASVKDNLPIIHICTPYDPLRVMPNQGHSSQVMEDVQRIFASKLLENRVFLFAENEYLAKHLAKTWDCHVGTLGLPAMNMSCDLIKQAEYYRRNILKVRPDQFLAISLGAARTEKGFHLLPLIVKRVNELAGKKEFSMVESSDLSFVFQASAQIVGRSPTIAKAIEELQGLPDSQVRILMKPLSDLDYRVLLVASDCLLMPYEQSAYRFRGSGIAVEALTARSLILATSDTYPARLAEQQGGASGETIDQMAQAMLKIVIEREQRSVTAARASSNYLARHSTRQYMSQILNAERNSLN